MSPHPNSWMITTIPFLIFMAAIVFFEVRQRRRERALQRKTNSYMNPMATATGKIYENRYGRPSTDIEKAFPEIRRSK